MKVFHLSQRPNRDSILENGVFPSIIKSPSHVDAFINRKIIRKRSDKIIYTWEDCNDNEKFAKDMIYCIVWLHGRNKMAMGDKLPQNFDFRDLPNVPIYLHDQMLFDLYVGEIEDKNCDFLHSQTSMSEEWTSYGMDEKYEHDNKKLHILKDTLSVNPVDELLYTYNRGKINIKFIP